MNPREPHRFLFALGSPEDFARDDVDDEFPLPEPDADFLAASVDCHPNPAARMLPCMLIGGKSISTGWVSYYTSTHTAMRAWLEWSGAGCETLRYSVVSNPAPFASPHGQSVWKGRVEIGVVSSKVIL